jgi:PKD repeat protein
LNPNLGYAAPYLYQTLTSIDYHDVTSGSNGDHSAGTGYDLVTGFGSLDLAQTGVDLALVDTPIIGVSPGSMHFDGSGSQILTVSNNGSGTLTYDFDTANYNRGGGTKPDDTFAFSIDDGSIEAAKSIHATVGTIEAEYAAIWLNRFPTYARLHLTNISIYWPNTAKALHDLTGLQPTLLIYYDADGDGDPGNAVKVYSGTVTISTTGGFQDYAVNSYISGPGDIYVGFADSWANGGYAPGDRPAAADTGSTARGQSFNIYKSSHAAPDLTTLGNNNTINTLAYNLMIRAAAASDYTSANCASPATISWLSVSPDSGTLSTGGEDHITVTTDATGLSPSGYSALLCIANNDPSRSTVVVPITFTVPNQPPTANFTFTTSGLTASFTDASSDSDGSIASRAWDFGDGQSSTAASPSHTYASAGNYTVKLTVTDNKGGTGDISKSVTVYAPPVAGFTVAANGYTAMFTDTSTVNNGTITSWAWTFDDYEPSATSTQANPTYTYPYNGIFHVTLTVTDSHGNTGSTAQDVTIYPPPAAGFTFATTALTANFTDTSSGGSGSAITTRAWTFGDGGTSSAQNPNHTYASGGTYTVTLDVTDAHGGTGSISKSVTVHVPPTADFTFTTDSLSANFTDASSGSDGTITTWAWTFGDGGTSAEQNPSHSYASGNTYTVTLTVTDSNGNTDSASKTVTVVDCGDEIFADGFDGSPLTCP